MRYKTYFFVLLLMCSFLMQCTTTSSYRYIPYTTDSYRQTSIESIEIFQNRLSISSKYSEIGVIKIADDYNLARIKRMAAERGADGIIIDKGNALLIKIREQQQESEPYEISI